MSRDTHEPSHLTILAAAPVLAALLGACLAPDVPAEREVASALVPATGQGTSYQGTSYQGTSYQGTSYQGTSYQGTSYQGASLGGVALVDGSIAGAALVAWRLVGSGKAAIWEQRFPDRTCTWDAFRMIRHGCTTVSLKTSPSPLAGSTWPATFLHPDGTTLPGTIRIDSVRADATRAMHPLGGSGSTCALDHTSGCGHPGGCRVNCDLWLYDLSLVDTGGVVLPFCAGGERAIAVAGTYAVTGERTADPDRFTFACTNGTIAKCTRWGYRPSGNAALSNGAQAPLAGYHQACVRAAAADYCANGHSFTRNGTLVDVWDYELSEPDAPGLIPRTRGGAVLEADATALVWESVFDPLGAVQIDHLRHEEIDCFGRLFCHRSDSITDADVGCPGRFYQSSDDVLQRWNRDSAYGAWVTPRVNIDSTPACAHSEFVVGKWLHERCSPCTRKVAAYCNDPADARGWDEGCIVQAKQLCTPGERMAAHGECTVGAALSPYDSGCTLAVCLEDPSCCGAGGWTAACVQAADATCEGGLEGITARFCGTDLIELEP